MNTLLTVDGVKLHAALASLKPKTIAAESAINSILLHIRTKPLYARDLSSFIATVESTGYDPELTKAKRILRKQVPIERLNVAIAFEAVSNVTRRQFFDVGVEAQNALSSLYNMNSALIMDAINSGALNEWKFNPVIKGLIDMANAAREAKMMAPENAGNEMTVAADRYPVPMILLTMIDEVTPLIFMDGLYLAQGANGALNFLSYSEASSFLTGSVNSMLNALQYMFIPDPVMPNMLRASGETLKYLRGSGIPDLSLNLSGQTDNAITINDRAITLEQFTNLFSTGNTDYVVSRTSVPGYGDYIQNLIDGITAIVMNRGAMLSNLAMKLTSESGGSTSKIYLGNSKERFFVIQTIDGVPYAVETYDNAYALLASPVLTSNSFAHIQAQQLFAGDLDTEASKFNAKRKLAEEMVKDLEDFKSLRAKLKVDIKELLEDEDANLEKIESFTNLLSDVEDSIDKTEKAIQELS